ncbi:serine/threonine protein kinase [Polyangium jinanense]|uniref:Protein kinase n=1 Tax=Polyangium jinanense TaxID=2829994 RepID=A0A9X4ASH6_9BACT|nr:serine/threonine protein kinase [Polyangium jinanense]MDC3955028.1 protein kinase [Polyangium jinanense]MDC3981202.1 protein kinase [Polyangium jinanense]
MSIGSVGSQPLFAGKYRLLRMLGKGAMGEVWLAEEEGPRNFRRRVAVKRLLTAGDIGDVATDSFVAEAQVIARLDHPNVVRLIELGNAEGGLYLVLEFVDGAALDRIFKRTGTLAPATVAYIGREVARALEAVHGMCDENGNNVGVVHRDVTPSNILVARDGRVRLSDFGVARISGLGGEKTETGVFKGKLPYMPPEQARGEPFDGRADVFALGITLFEGLLGRRLRKAETQTQLLMMIASEPVARVHELLPGVPDALAHAIDRATELDPRRRIADGGELAYLMDEALRALGPSAVKEAQAELRARVEQVAGAPAGGSSAPGTGQAKRPQEWSMQLGTGAQRPSGFPTEITRSSDAPVQPSYGTHGGMAQPGTGAGRISAPGYHPSMVGAPGSAPGSNPMSGGLGVTNVGTFADAGAPSSLQAKGRRSMVLPVLALAGFTILGGVTAFFVLSRSASGPRTDQAVTSASPSAITPAPTETIAAAPSTTAPDAQPTTTSTGAPSATPTATVAQGTGGRFDPKRTAQGSTAASTASAAAEEANSNEPGTLVVSVSPWADVTVDGRSVGTTPLAPISLAPGPHSVVLRNSELGASRSLSVTIKPGKPSSVRVDLRRAE